MVRRLLGTQVILIGPTTNTTCGTINSVNSNGTSVADQTYTVNCPGTAESTQAVLLYDNEIEGTTDLEAEELVMNIAEVRVYKDGDTMVTIKEVTCRSYSTQNTENDQSRALDGNPFTFYYSSQDHLPEWLKLPLQEASNVAKVVINNR